MVRHRTDRDAAEESFFELLEAEVSPTRNIPREARAPGKGDAQVQQANLLVGAQLYFARDLRSLGIRFANRSGPFGW